MVWARLKQEYRARLEGLGGSLDSDEQIRDMVEKLCEDLPTGTAAILRSN